MANDYAGVLIEHFGKTQELSEWAAELGIPYPTVRMRYARGVRDPDVLLSLPKFRKRGRPLGSMVHRVSSSLNHAFLDDIFSAEVVDKLRAVGRAAGLSATQVMIKIVVKGVNELHDKIKTD